MHSQGECATGLSSSCETFNFREDDAYSGGGGTSNAARQSM